MKFINPHHAFHMQCLTLISDQWSPFCSVTHHYSNNLFVLIYIWGTVMVDIAELHWQTIQFFFFSFLRKGFHSPKHVYDDKEKGERHSNFKALSGNLTFPHSIPRLFITPDGRALAHRKWSVSATGRGEGRRSDPQHVNQGFLWGSATLEDEVLLLWEKTVERYTCHNIDT